MGISSLFTAPEVNPINQKARTLPFFNIINVYGRVFFFSWFGFFLAFWSWYAFPPLLGDIIAKDLKFTKPQVANSNIIALVATLLVRLVAGPACDRFGPRKTFAATLLIGAVPTFCAGGIKNVSGLYAIRFFIGILGGSFVPCQVWSTGFFDKNIVGTANALAAGLGNAGGGVTYFVMPAIYYSLVDDRGLSSNTAWKVAFVVPGILIVFIACCLLLLCPDTPTGAWEDRFERVDDNLRKHSMVGVVDIPGQLSAEGESPMPNNHLSDASSHDDEKKEDLMPPAHPGNFADGEAQLTGEEMYETAKGEVIRKPTFKEVFGVVFTLQTLVPAACYFCSFGTELSVNSTLGTWYSANFKKQGLTTSTSGDWAAMFGLLNIVCRPLGGFAADLVYSRTGSVWGKKILLHAYALITGAFLIALGVVDSKDKSTMFGLIAGMAFFLEGGNGINYALVPHVHPYANGVVSGVTGAAGNLGGIVFALIFRFNYTQYGKSAWIIGVITIAVNILVCWIRPVAKGQVGGH